MHCALTVNSSQMITVSEPFTDHGLCTKSSLSVVCALSVHCSQTVSSLCAVRIRLPGRDSRPAGGAHRRTGGSSSCSGPRPGRFPAPRSQRRANYGSGEGPMVRLGPARYPSTPLSPPTASGGGANPSRSWRPRAPSPGLPSRCSGRRTGAGEGVGGRIVDGKPAVRAEILHPVPAYDGVEARPVADMLRRPVHGQPFAVPGLRADYRVGQDCKSRQPVFLTGRTCQAWIRHDIW